MRISIYFCLACALMCSQSLFAQPGKSLTGATAPARWELGTPETAAFPRDVQMALRKYAPEYTSVAARSAADLMLRHYFSQDPKLAVQVMKLGPDAVVPVGDALLAATDEYDAAAIWLSKSSTMYYATDEQYDSVKSILFRAQRTVLGSTLILKSLCDPRAVVLLKRLNFRIPHRATAPDVEAMLQREIDGAISAIELGACR